MPTIPNKGIGEPKKQPSSFARIFAQKGKKKKLTITVLKILVLLVCWISFFFLAAFVYYAHDLPDITVMANQDKKPQITIRSVDGTILAKYGDLRGDTLTYSQIPTHLIQAILAAEDRRFFDHSGIDVLGIIRAYYSNFMAGKVVQGGSTLTQQLAKIVYLSPERTFKRKIQEMMIAFQLEKSFSKEQILSMYINRVYMGKGNYGMDAAAEHYFGKGIGDLSLYECAVLASMLKAPSKYSPADNHKFVLARARYVLEVMRNLDYITQDELRKAVPPKAIERGIARGVLKNPYFSDYVLSLLPELTGNTNQDLDVYTTLDVNAQNALEKAVSKVLNENLQKYDAGQVAVLVMEKNGAIKAMLGGKAYDSSQYNRAVSAKRQPGSAFKMFVYTAALENGFSPEEIFTDKPISYPQGKGLPLWVPRNFTHRFTGDMTLRHAFAHSINTVAVQLSEQMGRIKAIKMAQRLGVRSNMPNFPSIALGVSEITLLEMTQALAHIANDGIKTEVFPILQILNAKNEIIYEHANLPTERVLSADIVESIKAMMVDVIDYGSGKAARLNGRLAYGKTGTTQDHRDAWFVGASDNLVAGVWLGNDNYTPMKKISGGNLPALIWKGVMSEVGEIKPTSIPRSSLPWKDKGIFDIIFDSDENEQPEQSNKQETL